MEFSPAATVTYDVTRKINLGVEYYGSWGQIYRLDQFDPYQEQQHQLFGVVNLDFGPQWEFNAGFGNGWTRATDHIIYKMILGRRLPF